MDEDRAKRSGWTWRRRPLGLTTTLLLATMGCTNGSSGHDHSGVPTASMDGTTGPADGRPTESDADLESSAPGARGPADLDATGETDRLSPGDGSASDGGGVWAIEGGAVADGAPPGDSGFALPLLPPIPTIPAARPLGSVPLGDPAAFPEVKMDFPIAAGPFGPTWPSINGNYPTKDSAWLRQAKFGIWVHFGPQAAGQSGDWYARKMYIENVAWGSPAYANHIRDFGHPSVAGYKDFCTIGIRRPSIQPL